MAVEVLIENINIRKEELIIELENVQTESSRVMEIIENEENQIEELRKELEDIRSQSEDINEKMQLTKGPTYRFKRALASLENNSRNIRERINNTRGTINRLMKEIEALNLRINDVKTNLSYFNKILKGLEDSKQEDIIEILVNLSDEYSNEEKIRDIFHGIIDLSFYRIRVAEETRIKDLTLSNPKDSPIFKDLTRNLEAYLHNPNINNLIFELIILWLGNISKFIDPSLKQGLEAIQIYKELNPNWIDDYQKVLDMYKLLRTGRSLEEFNDLVLILDTLLEEARKWNRDNKVRWVHVRCNDMEKILRENGYSYPVLRRYIRPVKHLRRVNV